MVKMMISSVIVVGLVVNFLVVFRLNLKSMLVIILLVIEGGRSCISCLKMLEKLMSIRIVVIVI